MVVGAPGKDGGRGSGGGPGRLPAGGGGKFIAHGHSMKQGCAV